MAGQINNHHSAPSVGPKKINLEIDFLEFLNTCIPVVSQNSVKRLKRSCTYKLLQYSIYNKHSKFKRAEIPREIMECKITACYCCQKKKVGGNIQSLKRDGLG